MYIGLTGYLASGKGAIAEILKEKGFSYTSLSDVVREETSARNLEQTRENLISIGNELRNKNGANYFAKKITDKLKNEDGGNWVIDGIRNPLEVKELEKLNKFYLMGVTSSQETIIERVLSRKRDGDSVTKEQIIGKLETEKGKGQPADGQQVSKCIDMSDYLIVNEGTIEELKNKTEHFLNLLSGEDRPNFNEVFMGLSYLWAERSTCLRRKVGSVIAKDSQQLTAGYNGAPRTMKHCKELGGCLREKLNIPSGQRHEICRGTHAEQNAITQAAKFGINIDGGTLYCNTHPCSICTKMIINAGLTKVVYDSDYDDPLAKEMLGEQHALELIRYEGLRNPGILRK